MPVIKEKPNSRTKISMIMLVLFLLLLPISTALSGIIGSISLLNYIALAFLVLSAAEVLCSGVITIKKDVLSITAYMTYALITCFWSEGFSLNYYFTTFAISYAILIMIACRKYTDQEMKTIKMTILLSAIVVLAATLINIKNTYAGRIVIAISSKMDPNDFGCGTCIILAFLLVDYTNNHRALSIIASLGIVGAVILTGSRGALLMCAVEFALWFLYALKKDLIRTVLLLSLFVIALVVLFSQLSPELLSRFSISGLLSSGGSGRSKIWAAGIKKFLQADPFHMVFGYGHGSFPSAVNYFGKGRNYPYEAHNIFINSIIEGGIVGTALLVNAFAQSFSVAYRRKNIAGFIALAGFFITGLTLDVQSYRIFPIAFVAAVFFENPNFIACSNRLTGCENESISY